MADEILKGKMEMLGEALEYMDRVLSQVDGVCESLRKKEGINLIAQISEGFTAILQIVEYTQDITEIKVDSGNIKEFVSEVVDGMENSDFNLVADIMEYELKPLYEEWGEVFYKVLNNDC
ncbi:MAG: hypothetical protein HFE59_04435 [Clostridiales bacterium]|nr:hypothetical protein [Clostridiales bacterium]